jgi:Xaa-Pro aminopeptidase
MQEKIRELFEKLGVDIILVRSFPHTTDPNFTYFSGLSTNDFHSNWLLLEKNKKPLVLCSSLEKVEKADSKRVRSQTIHSEKQVRELLQKKVKNKRIGLDYSFYPHSSFLKLKGILKPKKIVDITKEVGEARETKTKEEIRNIQNACRITEETLERVPDFVKPGKTEEQVALELEFDARKNGGEKLAFPTIVGFGKNAVVPHHSTGKTRIQKGNYLLVDFGIKYRHYSADISRTFFVGRPSEEQQWNYWVVWYSQELAFQQIRPGREAFQPFRAANEFLKKSFGQSLPHALGHGLGIEEHDWPQRMAPNENWRFKPEMVLTIEPAVYLKNRFGIRLEDDVRVTRTGCQWFSRAPAELVEI